jgi:NADH:ubiquinone oxidoreductase subunit E
MKSEDIVSIVDKHKSDGGGLISILEEIQGRYSYLTEEALKLVAEKTGKSLVDVYGVATFFRAFSLKPRGKHLVSVCLGTACHVRNAPNIAKEVQQQLGIKPGQTTCDREFTLETVNCLGACALGPVVVVDGRYFPHVTAGKVKQVLDSASVGPGVVGGTPDQRVFPIEVSCPRCNHSLIDRTHYIDGFPSIRITVSFGHLHGWLRLTSLYGRPPVKYNQLIPRGAVVNFFCPHCHGELVSASSCFECGAPMVPMIVRSGGMMQICSRRGCEGHMLDLTGVNF